MSIEHAPIVHRHSEESGNSERFALGGDFFQVAAEGFFALAQAGDDLKLRRVGQRRRAARVSQNRVEDLVTESALEREVIDSSALCLRKTFDLVHQACPFGIRQPVKIEGPPTDRLSE